MRYNSTGFFEEHISLLSFGGECLPRLTDGTIDREKVSELFNTAFNGGITCFFCSCAASGKESEEVFGENLYKRQRDTFFVGSGISPFDFNSQKEIETFIDEQLHRFHTGYFDFYIVENINSDAIEKAKQNGLHAALVKAKQLGKIRRVGFSFSEEHNDWRGIIKKYGWDFAAISANYLDWESKNIITVYHELIKRKLPFFAMDPFLGGKLLELPKNAVKVLFEADPLLSLRQWAIKWFFDKKHLLSLIINYENENLLSEDISVFSDPSTISTQKRHAITKVIEMLTK